MLPESLSANTWLPEHNSILRASSSFRGYNEKNNNNYK